MLGCAIARRVDPRRLSYIDAMRYLFVCLLGLAGVKNLMSNPTRPGRYCPRVIRRRKKEYDLLTEPRAVRIAREKQAMEV